jgi:hypothetical protein
VVAQSVQGRKIKNKDAPEHFFEVSPRDIPRYRNDWLLNPGMIENYLPRVAPRPFAPLFKYAGDITATLYRCFLPHES